MPVADVVRDCILPKIEINFAECDFARKESGRSNRELIPLTEAAVEKSFSIINCAHRAKALSKTPESAQLSSQADVVAALAA